MEARATAKIKIKIHPYIVKTIKVYGRGLQFCVNTAWKKGIKNHIRLHPFVYKKLRDYGLQSQLAVNCIKQACGMVKSAKTKPIINNISIQYNFPRSASFNNNVLSLATIKGRVKIPFTIPDCYKEYFTWKVCESLLRIDKKGRCFFLFTFSKEVNIKSSCFQNRVLGVDLGINNLAVCSDGRIFKSNKTKIKQFQFLNNRLRAKGTKSARRLLKRISGGQKRFVAWVNHNVSKKIVASADMIVLENLKGIRSIHRGKRMNRWVSNWSFFQLQKFIKYKAEREGKIVLFANPYMTSQTCSNCGKVGSRYFDSFCCSHCGFSSQSDFNASCNLRRHPVTMPYILNDESEASFDGLSLNVGIKSTNI